MIIKSTLLWDLVKEANRFFVGKEIIDSYGTQMFLLCFTILNSDMQLKNEKQPYSTLWMVEANYNPNILLSPFK
jgi:hypothetical protein